MKRNFKTFLIVLAASAGAVGALAQGTAFPYQGHLIDGGIAANGSYDMQFTLYNDAGTPGNVVVGAPVIHLLAGVNAGVFSTNLDFGSGVFTGASRWLEIGVRTNGSVAPYTVLTPRQQLTPTPYAIYAENAGAANSVQSSSISAPQLNTTGAPGSGQLLGYNGSSLVWMNSATASGAWGLTGNAGTVPTANFLGTQDNEPMELHVNGGRAWRIEPTGTPPNIFPNLIGGFAGNVVNSGAQGATIGGGGTVGYVNQVSATLGTVAGGSGNVIQNGANDSTIAGGRQNQISAGAWQSTIGGGTGNVIQTNASGATIAGGNANTAGTGAAIPGGFHNIASGIGSFAAGGNAHATHNGDFVWCDGTQILTDSGPNRFEVLASGGAYFHNSLDVAGPMTLDSGNLEVLNGTVTIHSGDLGLLGGTVKADGGTSSFPPFPLPRYIAQGVTGTAAGSASIGVNGTADGWGVYGSTSSSTGTGVGGDAPSGVGVSGTSSTGVGVYGRSTTYDAGHFDGNVYISRNATVCTLTIRGGCDLAEPFEMSNQEIPKGAVVVIDDANAGRLKISDRAYDQRVAGIVSGANGINPGISLHQDGALEGGQNVALSGRVYVLADAASGPIRAGDLLTTSATPGHAMKVGDHGKAQGAILGKAMSSLKEGKGLVLVLVTLQ